MTRWMSQWSQVVSGLLCTYLTFYTSYFFFPCRGQSSPLPHLNLTQLSLNSSTVAIMTKKKKEEKWQEQNIRQRKKFSQKVAWGIRRERLSASVRACWKFRGLLPLRCRRNEGLLTSVRLFGENTPPPLCRSVPEKLRFYSLNHSQMWVFIPPECSLHKDPLLAERKYCVTGDHFVQFSFSAGEKQHHDMAACLTCKVSLFSAQWHVGGSLYLHYCIQSGL